MASHRRISGPSFLGVLQGSRALEGNVLGAEGHHMPCFKEKDVLRNPSKGGASAIRIGSLTQFSGYGRPPNIRLPKRCR